MENVVTYVIGLKDNLSSGVSQATANVSKLDGAVGSVKSSVMSLGSAMGLAFGVAGVAMFVSKVVSAGSVVEDATTGLTTLLKDSGEAAQVVKNTMEDATKTPFSFEGLLAGNKALISAGQSAERSREDVLNLANAIAATGGGNDELQRMVINMQQISNTGRASAMDIKQFGFAGINIYQVLADATGKTIDQVKELPVTYDMLTEALKKAAKEGGIYANGLENMSNNVSVKLSNVGDSLFVMFNDIFVETRPLIVGLLNTALEAINKLSSAVIGIIGFIKEYKTAIIILSGAFIAYKTVKIALIGVEAIHQSMLLQQALSGGTLTVVQQLLAVSTMYLSSAMTFLNATMLANPAFWIIAALVGVALVVNKLVNHFGGFTNAVKATWDIIKAFASSAASAFVGFGKAVWGAITFNPALIKEGVAQTLNAVKTGAQEIQAVWNNSDAQKASAEAKKSKEKSKLPTKGAKQQADVGPSETPMPKTKAEGAKNINIKIEYNAPLIKGFTISTTNVKQGINSLKEEISAVLTGATHDALLVADY